MEVENVEKDKQSDKTKFKKVWVPKTTRSEKETSPLKNQEVHSQVEKKSIQSSCRKKDKTGDVESAIEDMQGGNSEKGEEIAILEREKSQLSPSKNLEVGPTR